MTDEFASLLKLNFSVSFFAWLVSVSVLCEAKSLTSALYRFSTFWNLLLDDYQFTLTPKGNTLELALLAQNDAKVQRFGHMLILKLAHGLIFWLDRKEVARV